MRILVVRHSLYGLAASLVLAGAAAAQDCSLAGEPAAADARPPAAATLRRDWTLGGFHPVAAPAPAPGTAAAAPPATAPGFVVGPANVAGTPGARSRLIAWRTTDGNFFNPATRWLTRQLVQGTDASGALALWRARLLRRQAERLRVTAQAAAAAETAAAQREQARTLEEQAAALEAEAAAARQSREPEPPAAPEAQRPAAEAPPAGTR